MIELTDEQVKRISDFLELGDESYLLSPSTAIVIPRDKLARYIGHYYFHTIIDRLRNEGCCVSIMTDSVEIEIPGDLIRSKLCDDSAEALLSALIKYLEAVEA